MQKCANCGTILDDSKVVCYMCGASLVEKDEEVLDNFDMSLNDLGKEDNQSLDFKNNTDDIGTGLNALNSSSQNDSSYSDIESLDETGFDSLNNDDNIKEFNQIESNISEVVQSNNFDNNQFNNYDNSMVSLDQEGSNTSEVEPSNSFSDNQFNSYDNINSFDQNNQYNSYDNSIVGLDQNGSNINVEQPNNINDTQFDNYGNVNSFNQNNQYNSYDNGMVGLDQNGSNINVEQPNNINNNQFNNYGNVNSFDQNNQYNSYDNSMVGLDQNGSNINVEQPNNINNNQFDNYGNVNSFDQNNQYNTYDNNYNQINNNNSMGNVSNSLDSFSFFNNQNANNASMNNNFYYETQNNNNNMQTWDENIAYNSYSAKKSSSALIFNFISLAVFLGVLVFVYFKFIKKDVNYVQFNNLSYNEPSSYNEKKDGKNITYSKKNCVIKMNYENSGVDSQYITKYFDSIIESKSKEKNLSFQFIDLKINSNLWSGLNVLLVDDKNLNSLKEKERYISILYSGNVYNISYYNNSFSEECTNDFDELLGSLEFTNKK